MAFQPGAFQGDAFQGAGSSGLTLDAILRASGSGSFSLDAVIVHVGTFTLSAVAGRAQSGSLPLNGVKSAVGSGSFALNAVVLVLAISDDFERPATTSYHAGGVGITPSSLDGTAYEFQGGEFVNARSFSDTFLTGHLVSLRGRANFSFGPDLWDTTHLYTGVVQFDVLIPSASSSQFSYLWCFYADSPTRPAVFDITNFLTPTSIKVRALSVSGTPTLVTLAVSVGDWVRIKLKSDGVSQFAKAWKVGDPEPANYSSGAAITETDDSGLATFQAMSFHAGDVLGLDNLFGWTGGKRKPWRQLTLNAFVQPYFRLNAFIRLTGGTLLLRAVIRTPRLGKFDLSAVITRGFRLSAWISPGKTTRLDAIVRRPQSGSFSLDAVVVVGGAPHFSLDAIRRQTQQGAPFTLAASLFRPQFAGGGSFDLDGWIIGTTESFALYAQIASPATPTGSLALDAFLSQTYRLRFASLDATLRAQPLGQFNLYALIVPRTGHYTLDAVVALFPSFTFDARIASTFTLSALIVNPGRQFTIDAYLNFRGYGMFNLDAVIASGYFTLDAWVRAASTGTLPLLAMISIPRSGSFTLNAAKAGAFFLNAFIRPHFTLSAFIRDDRGTMIFPPGGGPPIDAGTGLPFSPPERQARIQVLIDGEDWTENVEVAEMEFVQAARVGPGTFTVPLKGAYPQFNGGEEVLYLVDGFRQFGGFVRAPVQGYHFVDVSGGSGGPLFAEQPRTILTGVDFNGLFDQIVIYNAAFARADPGHGGPYDPIPPLPKGMTDKAIIEFYWANYIEEPWKKLIDFTTYVEEVGIPSPETPFTWRSGDGMRLFMQGMSRMTNAVWYIDPYYNLRYHRRGNANAPFAITDGDGGISCRNLNIGSAVASMNNDSIVWGVLASTISGEITYARQKDAANIERYGLWQYAETRSDLHLQKHVNLRAKSIKDRSDLVFETAHCEIFERGFQAGQVATLTSVEWGFSRNLVIRQQRMTVLASQPPIGDIYYGIPLYELDLGLQPDDPWDFYDMIPFENFDAGTPSVPTPRRRPPHLQLWNRGDTNKGEAEPCAPTWTDGAMTIFRDDFERVITGEWWGDGGCGAWEAVSVEVFGGTIYDHQANLSSPPPWCVVIGILPADDGGFRDFGFFNSAPEGLPSVMTDHDFGVQYTDSTRMLTWGANNQTGSSSSGSFHMDPDEFGFRPIFIRVQRSPNSIRLRVWAQDEAEPVEWLPNTLDQGGEASHSLGGRFVFRGEQLLTGIAVSGAPGFGYVWLRTPDDVAHGDMRMTDLIYSPLPSATYGISLWPGGTRPPDDGTSGINNAMDVNCTSGIATGGGVFPRNTSWSITHTPPNGNTVLNRLVWDWMFGEGDAGSLGAADNGRMLIDQREVLAFAAPNGAHHVRIQGVLYFNTIETGFLSVGSQPHPSGEGPLGFQLFKVNGYDGSSPSFFGDVIAQGVLGDYIYGPDFFPTDLIRGPSQAIDITLPVTGGQIFQIAGQITNGTGSLLSTHRQGPLLNNGWKRVLELKIANMRIWYQWGPSLCGDDSDLIGEFAACEDEATDDPFYDNGWGSETRRADRTTGAFSIRVPATPQTLQVYVRGKFMLPHVQWEATDDTGLNYRLATPGPVCVRVTYLAPANIVARWPATRVETSANLPADRMRLPDVRGLQ